MVSAGAALVGAAAPGACAGGDARPMAASVRLVHGRRASAVERAVIADAAALVERATRVPIPVIVEGGGWGTADVLVAATTSSDAMIPSWRCADASPGAYRLHAPLAGGGPRVAIAGADAEGARNGLYRYLQDLGFGFFRDGEVVPDLTGAPLRLAVDAQVRPAFRWRGDMIWDFYLGPRRYCAAAWTAGDWERALLFLARNGLNFLEFYPPLEAIWHDVFPDAGGLDEGAVWKAAAKHELARQVLARGRALGIQFMYVLTYGAVPPEVQRLHPRLAWANGFLCAGQPELQAFTRRAWGRLVETFGTDHLYAIRHRGEEGQEYSDPCRSVSKAEGLNQAIAAVRQVDPDAIVSVWTWGEEVPDLFRELPPEVRAAHIRHGMGGVFADMGSGREQADGAPPLPPARRWLSGQFTVFSGSETLLQTSWSSPEALARDARAAARDPNCDGYFQWPEWSGTSPWLSHVIARLAWAPQTFDTESALEAFAAARHGRHAPLLLSALRPLVQAGHARFTTTPRKRLLVPYFMATGQMALLAAVRTGLGALWRGLPREAAPLLERDGIDLASWAGVRQAHVFEAAAYLAQRGGDGPGAQRHIDAALATWSALARALATVADLSLVETARAIARAAPLSARALDTLWTNACDFYKGYPLAVTPESIELVFAVQCRRLGEALATAASRGTRATLAPPGWYWHDFPDPAWTRLVARLPDEDAHAFEAEMRRGFESALVAGARDRTAAGGGEPWTGLAEGRATPAWPSPPDRRSVRAEVAAITDLPLPEALTEAPEGLRA